MLCEAVSGCCWWTSQRPCCTSLGTWPQPKPLADLILNDGYLVLAHTHSTEKKRE